jgi:hypothetical protein
LRQCVRVWRTFARPTNKLVGLIKPKKLCDITSNDTHYTLSSTWQFSHIISHLLFSHDWDINFYFIISNLRSTTWNNWIFYFWWSYRYEKMYIKQSILEVQEPIVLFFIPTKPYLIKLLKTTHLGSLCLPWLIHNQITQP